MNHLLAPTKIQLSVFVVFFFMGLLSQGSTESRSANARVNDSIVYHGKIVNPAGTPLEGSVAVRIKIFSPEPSVCLLWSEQQTIVARKGGFSMELGYAENRIAGPNGGVAADFRSVFINNPGLTHASASCVVGSSYTPSKNDDRLMSAEFVDNGVSSVKNSKKKIKVSIDSTSSNLIRELFSLSHSLS